MDIKIYKLNDYDWVAAETLEQAKKFYEEYLDMSGEEDVMFDDPRELTDEELDRLKHYGDDGERVTWSKERVPTFRQELSDMIAQGEAFPCLFASTEY